MAITQYKGTIQRPGQRPETVEIAAHTVPQLTSAEKAAGIQWVDGRYEPGDVRRYGAALDGSTDITSELQEAINVMGQQNGGVVKVAADSAITTGSITFPSGGSVIVDFCGTQCNVDVSGIAFDIDGQGLATNDPKHQIIRGHFQSSTSGAGTCIRIRDSQQQVVRDCEFHDFDKAIQLAINTSGGFCESNVLENILFEGNNYMVHITRTGGNFSFSSTQFSHIIGTTGNAVASPAYGIYIDTDCDIYRSVFHQVVIFPAASNSVGFYCDGKMRNTQGLMSMEGNNGSATGNIAFQFGANADQLITDLMLDFRGTIATNFSYAGASQVLEGVRTGHTNEPPAYIRRQGAAVTVRSIFDDDFSTRYFSERLTSSDRLQWQVDASVLPEFKRLSDTSKLAGIRLLPVGNETPGAFSDGDATPSVDGNDFYKTANTGTTTITNLDGGISGQTVWILIDDGNTTIDFTGTNLSGNAGVDWSPASGDFMVCRYTGSKWLCQVHDTTA